MSFKELGVSAPIIKSIEEIGFKTPTDVQEASITEILNKQDLIVMAKTGSGKTGAFGIPIIQSVSADEKHTQALIITPTRELAVQVDKDIKTMSKYTDVKSMAVYGQHSMNVEIADFKKGRQIVVGTPGRVFHHIQNKSLVTKNIKYLVLDEADRMLDMGFIDQMIKIIKALPRDRVTLLFSATMPSEIQKICKAYMKMPKTIELESDTKTVDSIKQAYFRVERNDKRTQLSRILTKEQPNSCMIFCNTRIEVDKVHQFLSRKGFVSEALHGANTQSRRMRTIADFKAGEIQLLVATDVAARGIHIDDLSLVINYDIPLDKDSYIHRIGRTGRAGNGGIAMALVTSDDIYTLYEIEEHVGAMIEETDLPTDEEVENGRKNVSEKWELKKQERKAKEANRPRPSHKKTHPQKKSHATSKSQKDHRTSHHSGNKPHRKPHEGKPQQRQPQHAKPHHNKPQHKKPHVHKPVEHVNKPVHQVSKPVEQVKKPVAPVVNTPDKTKKKSKFSFKKLFSRKKTD